MDVADMLKPILIRQAGHVGLLRALIATHPNRAALLTVLRNESLLVEAKNLNNPQMPDGLREEVKAEIEGWIKLIESGQ